MVTRKKTDVVQLSKIRMREDLRSKLANWAEDAGRTLNAEIVDRLERSFNSDLAAERDRAMIALMVGGDLFSAMLMRFILFELQRNPHWADSPKSIDELAKFIDHLVRSVPSKDPNLRPREE